MLPSKGKDHMFAENIKMLAKQNTNFRTVLHTGKFSQLVAMSLPEGTDIGEEVHTSIDQIFFIIDGECESTVSGEVREVEDGGMIFVPAGKLHNIKNIGDEELKIITIYSPPAHADGTVHLTKSDAQKAEY